ncbi:MAG: hypothetical protein IBJ11_04320 [Phycisphaerales bacterium]|nr:hypothetical protein [Phycisphaerales bacterium]
MSKSSILVLVLLIVGVLGGFVIFKSQERRSASEHLRGLAQQMIRPVALEKDNPEYFAFLLTEQHDAAFAAVAGGYLSPTNVDEDRFLSELRRRMIERAKEQGRTAEIRSLTRFAEAEAQGR